MTKRNIKISINDLTRACVVLGEAQVVAAGSIWATLAVDVTQRMSLSQKDIRWSFD